MGGDLNPAENYSDVNSLLSHPMPFVWMHKNHFFCMNVPSKTRSGWAIIACDLISSNRPKRFATVFSLFLALGFVPWAASAAQDEISESRRAIEAMQTQIDALLERIQTLETERSQSDAKSRNQPVSKHGDPRDAAEKDRIVTDKSAESSGSPLLDAPPPTEVRDKQRRLERRVRELELSKSAEETAIRSIIKDSVSTLGSNINESISLGGSLEVKAGWSKDFTGPSQRTIRLNTTELDFEIRASEWVLGNFIIEYDDGTSSVVTTTDDSEQTIDRINLDTASLTFGDVQRFPVYAKLGRMVLPFGTGTGSAVADALTVEDPLTIEVFETRQTAIGLGVAWPTPTPSPASPPVYPPAVKPQVLGPIITSMGQRLGYQPPPRQPPAPTPYAPAPDAPQFNAGIYFYDGDTFDNVDHDWSPLQHIDATVGYRTKGHCGRRYDQLRVRDFCPWSYSVDLAYNGSVFDSRFLSEQYQEFLGQIGFVPGMAVAARSALGPVSLVAEWNGAIGKAKFTDDSNRPVSLTPATWQVSLGYQFDWNPWVESIGAQGTYLSVGYSESQDLAGVSRTINGVATRSGFVPRRRALISVGEWVTDSLRVAIEYSHNRDYAVDEGGTGNSANGVFGTFTYVW